jgi:DNA-directed RNA polymerase specialized sigma24 family protein
MVLQGLWRRLWRRAQVEVGNVRAGQHGWWARAVPRREGMRHGIDDPAVDKNGKLTARTIRIDYIDEFAAPPVPEQDWGLRALVDNLPPEQKHLVERVYFGRETPRRAAREIGLSIAVADRLLREAREQIKSWLETGAGDPGLAANRAARPSAVPRGDRCTVRTRWGRCAQPVVGAGLCAAHEEWAGSDIQPDPEYHRRVVLGEVTPIQAKLSPVEINATMQGRYRGDGRRLDAYVTHAEIGS